MTPEHVITLRKFAEDHGVIIDLRYDMKFVASIHSDSADMVGVALGPLEAVDDLYNQWVEGAKG